MRKLLYSPHNWDGFLPSCQFLSRQQVTTVFLRCLRLIMSAEPCFMGLGSRAGGHAGHSLSTISQEEGECKSFVGNFVNLSDCTKKTDLLARLYHLQGLLPSVFMGYAASWSAYLRCTITTLSRPLRSFITRVSPRSFMSSGTVSPWS